MISIFPGSLFPHLPPKSLASSTNLIDNTEFIEQRTKELDAFLKKLLTNSNIYNNKRLENTIQQFLDKKSEVGSTSF